MSLVSPIRNLPAYGVTLQAAVINRYERGEDIPASMEMAYQNGQILWVRCRASLRPGKVGISVYDSSSYMKLYTEQDLNKVHFHGRSHSKV